MLATKWKVGCQRFLDQNMQFGIQANSFVNQLAIIKKQKTV